MDILNNVVEVYSSSSSITYDHKYDVFLSFRGLDTRLSFTNHLHTTLLSAKFTTFLDEEGIQTGDLLKPELENAIKTSKASIIVLSENYACSSWCLDELVLILEQHRNHNQIVIPVFYHVEPTHVRKQQSSFGKAMEKHKLKMEAETNVEEKDRLAEKIKIWKNALTQVSNLKGKDAKGRLETELIKEIVHDLYSRLGVPIVTNTLSQLIGMEDYIESINSWLKDGSFHSADILTIWGMGGIGKTSLAKHVFELNCREYLSSFVGDISRRCGDKHHGLLDVQKQLCDDISNPCSFQVHDVVVYTSMIENAVARKKVLLVLDDVDSFDQLDALLGNKGFHSGSKIVITTKDASLIQRCALFKTKVKPNHTECTLEGLSDDASLKLLCHHAFTCSYPIKGYEEVSKRLARYCHGHPLALEVLGKSLHKRDVGEWEDSIESLKKEPHSHIKNALMMSFDTLPFENDKDLFKHIACFFVGIDKDLTETILNACDIKTRSGIKNLIDRCLLRIEWDNKLVMHQLVQEMGRDLVRQESRDKPWERSRLWCHEESFKVLKQKKGTENLLGLALDMRMLDKKKLCGPFELKTKSLSKMDNLMLLQLNYVQLSECFKDFPEELRWLCMHGFPLKTIQDLPMRNLVALDMSYSNIELFDVSYNNPQPLVKRQKLDGSCSKDRRLLGSLKILDLSSCEQLHSLGGFFELPALERLIIRKCISLIEICESVTQCVELIYIDLSFCYKLAKHPISISKLKKVKTLLLDGCNSREARIEDIPRDLKLTMFSLPSSLRILSLANNNLCNGSFPIDLSSLSMLEELCLDNNPIVSMPNCVRTLPRLERLYMEDCYKVISIKYPPRILRVLSICTHTSFKCDYRPLLREIKFELEMSPLNLLGVDELLSSFVIDGRIKIQDMASVKEKILHSLGWKNIEFIKERSLETHKCRGWDKSQTQMYYEFGIFSTMYEGKEMPKWIRCRSEGTSVSITIPSYPKMLRGINLCCVQTNPHSYFKLPMIKISNITKNQTWIYKHYIEKVKLGGKGSICLLSHWMFGPNEMKGGDHITIIVERLDYKEQVTKECGIGLVYDDVDGKMEEVDGLGYYKSWNHIIGGDLSAFQLTTGKFILDNWLFKLRTSEAYYSYHPFIDDAASYKEDRVVFKAFSQKKNTRGQSGL